MTALALALCAAFLVLSALHFLWALGYWMPLRDEQALARAVVGLRGVRRMPGPVPVAAVACALFFLAILPFLNGFPARQTLMALAALILVLRGLAAYLPAWRAIVPEDPFARLDTRLYGPLCLALGAGEAALVTGGF